MNMYKKVKVFAKGIIQKRSIKMKVKTLIEALSKYNWNSELFVNTQKQTGKIKNCVSIKTISNFTLNKKSIVTLNIKEIPLTSSLISIRTKTALKENQKAGIILGRPKLKSKLDNKEDKIRGLVTLGVKQKVIAKKVGCTEMTLSNWLKRKKKEWNLL